MKSNIVPKASPDALPELEAFLEPFAPLFRRHTSRDSMERYLTGLLTDLPHKTADTIAAAVAGTSTERLQHLLTDATWDAQALDEARVKRLLALHPPKAGVLVFDDTGLPKKGTESVGVAAQYSGTLGKIGNCQVVVSAEYLADDPASSTPFHWPVSAQLFVPESWVADAERRKRTHVPAEVGEQTKPAIALGLLDRAREWGVPIEAVVVDAGYGDNPNFLTGLDERQMPYVCAVQSTFGVRLPDEVQAAEEHTPTYGGRGQPLKPRPAPQHQPQPRPHRPRGLVARRAPCPHTHESRAFHRRAEAPGRHRKAGSGRGARSGGDEVLVQLAAPRHLVGATCHPGSRALGDRAVLRRCQAGMWSGRLPGATLGWLASAPGTGHVGLQFPHAATVAASSACGRGLSPPQSHVALCLTCIGRCCSGFSRISSSGSSRPTRLRPF